MKRNLIAALGVTLMAVALSGYVLYLVRHENDISTRGHLQLSFLETFGESNRANSLQLEARARRVTANHVIHDMGIKSDKRIRAVYAGKGRATFLSWNGSAPLYDVEVKKDGKWSVILTFTDPICQYSELRAGEAIDFPVMVPEGVESWRISLQYTELPPPPSKLTRVMDHVYRLLSGRPPGPLKLFIVRSDEFRN